MSASETIRAIAYETGWNSSPVITSAYTTTATVANPTFTPAGGSYSSAQTVTIGTTTTGASIRYTTDGSTPSPTLGTIYSGPVTVSASETIANAICFTRTRATTGIRY